MVYETTEYKGMDETALATIALLERRLERILFLLSGKDVVEDALQNTIAQGKDQTVYARLANIETGLSKLSSKSPVIRDLLDLYSVHSELFQPTLPESTPTTLTRAELITIINSCATAYPITVSRLTSIQDLPIPSAESSAFLIALYPRIARLELLQESQAKEMADLRLRSASVMQRWYEFGVLGGGDCWTEWEGRLSTVEKGVKQKEIFQAKEKIATEAYKSGKTSKAVRWEKLGGENRGP